MGMSVTGDVSSWDVMKPAEIPRDPMRGPVEFEAASARSDAVQGAERAGALPAATDPGPLGDFRPSWSRSERRSSTRCRRSGVRTLACRLDLAGPTLA